MVIHLNKMFGCDIGWILTRLFSVLVTWLRIVINLSYITVRATFPQIFFSLWIDFISIVYVCSYIMHHGMVISCILCIIRSSSDIISSSSTRRGCQSAHGCGV